jgi:hypothetical protein
VREVVLIYPGGREGVPITGLTTDDTALALGRDIVQQHYVGHLRALRGDPVPDLELADAVTVRGVAQAVHYLGSVTWQVKGYALLRMAGIELPKIDLELADYRTERGRLLRGKSSSAERAREICEAIERGEHPRDAIARHRPPRPAEDPDAPWARTFAPGPVITTSGPMSHWPRPPA